MEQELLCPKCGSKNLSANKKGFKVGKAIAGGIIAGGAGALIGGTAGSNKIQITCLNCGHIFKPGEGATSKTDFETKKRDNAKTSKWAIILLAILLIIGLFLRYCGSSETKKENAAVSDYKFLFASMIDASKNVSQSELDLQSNAFLIFEQYNKTEESAIPEFYKDAVQFYSDYFKAAFDNKIKFKLYFLNIEKGFDENKNPIYYCNFKSSFKEPKGKYATKEEFMVFFQFKINTASKYFQVVSSLKESQWVELEADFISADEVKMQQERYLSEGAEFTDSSKQHCIENLFFQPTFYVELNSIIAH